MSPSPASRESVPSAVRRVRVLLDETLTHQALRAWSPLSRKAGEG